VRGRVSGSARAGRPSLRPLQQPARERVGLSLAGLLERVERKNGWQLAEVIGEAG